MSSSKPSFTRSLYLCQALCMVLATTGCISVKTHSTIEPIYLTLDVNLKVQLQQELDSVFADIDAASQAIEEE
ncbi:MAG: hypothetical protein O7C75_08840 [Verrucomicrobia bacterium]|nr:hypothetical protein [Verrucomicrobiota bacterium]